MNIDDKLKEARSAVWLAWSIEWSAARSAARSAAGSADLYQNELEAQIKLIKEML